MPNNKWIYSLHYDYLWCLMQLMTLDNDINKTNNGQSMKSDNDIDKNNIDR